MKKSTILVLSAAMLALVGCQGGNTSNTSSQNPNTSSQNPTSQGGTTQGGTSQGGTTTSSQQQTSMNQSQALALFREALNKDYSNVTLFSYQQYDDGEMAENDYEFIADGYVVDYSWDLASEGMDPEECYSFYYVEDDGTSWMYFPKEKNNEASQEGWLNKGYKDADLSIWRAYFYLPLLLNNITVDDISYSNGLYFVNSSAKVAELNYSAFGYAYYNDIIDIAFLVNDGYISKIYGFCDSSSNPVNFVQIELFNFGVTTMPSLFDSILPFSEEAKIGYWQYKGWEQDYAQAYYKEIHANLATEDLEKDETHDVVIDVDKKFEVSYSVTPEEFKPWDIVDDKDKVVTWHYDSSILEMTYSNKSQTRTFRGIGDGETEVYVTVNGENGILESEHIKVQVNGLKEQDKTNAVFDFLFENLVEAGEAGNLYYEVEATNAVNNDKPYTITAGKNVGLRDGKYADADYFENGKQYLIMSPSSSNAMNQVMKTQVLFDLGEEQVSKISFNYALYYSNHKVNLSYLRNFYIRTSNDGETWNEVDIASVIKENLSSEFVKNYELEFEPAKMVEIKLEASILGKNLDISIDSVCFMK